MIRSAHPGVVLIPPDVAHNHPTWRARFDDPDLGRSTKVRLDPVALRTAGARRDWAIRKSRALAQRRMAIEGGAHKATGTGLAVALASYFTDHPQLRSGTLGIYRRATGRLSAWAATAGVRSADDLTGAKLTAFRAVLVRAPLRAPIAGGKRGARSDKDAEARSPQTVNVDLRSVRTVLGHLRKLGLLPRITSDDLKDSLQRLPVDHDRTQYLKPVEIQALIESTLRHDAAVFAATREEHAGLRPLGSTMRYHPIAPLIATAVLTGMRFGEAAGLTWAEVDLEALGDDGQPVGEIHLTAATKTKRARSVDLTVSPALRDLLLTMYKRDGGQGAVFAGTRLTAEAAAKRLRKDFGAPKTFTWQALRRTCGTFLTNAPGIFGAASAYRSARQLGHSVAVAERHYVGVIRGIPRDARTLEAAMQIEAQMKAIIEAVGAAPAKAKKLA